MTRKTELRFTDHSIFIFGVPAEGLEFLRWLNEEKPELSVAWAQPDQERGEVLFKARDRDEFRRVYREWWEQCGRDQFGS